MKFNPFANLRETAYQFYLEIVRRKNPDSDFKVPHPEQSKDEFIYVFDGKWYSHCSLVISYHYGSLLELFTKGLLDVASQYIDPDKASDFVNYPELNGWTKESLKEKLGDEFIEPSPFVKKWQYLLFMCKVLKLCHIKRFTSSYGSTSRTVYNEKASEVISILKEKGFDSGSYGRQFIEFSRDTDESEYDCTLRQGKFVDEILDSGKAERIKTYAYVTKGDYDNFDALGAVDVDGNPLKENAWNCVPANINFDESRLDTLRIPAKGESYSMGFTFEKCIAVCDYSAHFNIDNG